MLSRTHISALAVLILLAVAAPAAARSRTVRVPHVSGDVTRAYATLHRDGLRVSIAHPFTVRSDQITTVTRTAPAHLAPLRGASQPTLLANYVVSRQAPAAGSTLAGASQLRLSGRPGSAAACLPPLYGRVVAKDDLAEVSSVTESNLRPGELVPGVIYSGCVYSRNHQLTLTTTYTHGNADFGLSTPVLAGTEVAAVTAAGPGKYRSGPVDFGIETWNLDTGSTARPYDAGNDFLDQLVVDPAGFTAWHAVTVPGGTSTPLQDVSCPTTTFCAAVDAAGSVFTTTNPAGGRSAWTQATLPVGSLSGISCQSPTLCVAVSGSQVFVSTNPTGGASAWTATPVPGASLAAVACPTTTLCVAVGQNGIATSTNPTGGPSAWTFGTVSGVHTLNDVACPTSGLCVASDSAAGNIASATSPSAGAAAWSVADVNGTQGLSGVACASPSLCVSGDFSGDMLSSTNPSGGLPAWQLTHVGTTSFSRFSCPSSSLCVGGAQSGVVTSGTPTGGDGAWTVSAIPGSGTIASVSCPSTTLCVGSTRAGRSAPRPTRPVAARRGAPRSSTRPPAPWPTAARPSGSWPTTAPGCTRWTPPAPGPATNCRGSP